MILKQSSTRLGELREVIVRMRTAGLAFVVVMVLGTFGFYFVGGPNTTLIDAFYMMGITVSTVGYEEVIELDHHPYARVFTVLLAFAGIGVLTYFVSNTIALLVEGDLRKTFKLNRMEQAIGNLKGHYIICGCGRVGRRIGNEMYQTHRPFLIADQSMENLESFIQDAPGSLHIIGDCTDDDFLIKLGIEYAAGLFATTGDDNTNLVISLTARQLSNTLKIVARNNEPQNFRKLKSAGANSVVSPNQIGGLRMATEMLRPTFSDLMDDIQRHDTDARFEEVAIPEWFHETPFGKLPIHDLKRTMVIAIQSGDSWIYKPDSEVMVLQGDHLVLLTNARERELLDSRLS